MQPTGKFIEAAALLSHIKMLESRLPEDENQFGHPQPPQLHMCRIPDPDRVGGDLGVVAMMAVTKRCISAQLLRESVTFTAVGAPVEVLVMSGVDRINCASLVALEHPELTAADTLIVADRDSGKSADSQPVLSLMSGGIVPVAPSPRVAVVVGTSDSRVITIEFSVKPVSMQLVRRNFFAGEQVRSYYEPLPWDTLTEAQQKRRRLPLSKQLSRVSIDSDKTDGAREPRGIVPFVVTDGVKTIEQYSIVRNEKSVTYVWISFGDGTAVRVHHAALFASVVQKHAESQPNKKSLEEVLGDQVIRWQAKLPPLEDTRVTLFPIPKYHPSPLAPIPSWKIFELEDKEDDPAGENGKHEDRQEFFEAILYCTGAMADSFPTLTFYTSENQFGGRIQGDPEVETQDRDAGALKGIIGGLLGIFSGGGNSPPEEESGVTPELARDMSKEDVEVWDPAVPLPSINFEPLSLFAGCEIHDPPRQITFCTIDPEGDLAAFADTLGRVSLVDLASKQIIRMWKGFRDTSCSWIQVPQENRQKPWQKNKVLYLVIHSRQRKVVEVWRTRHGPKVKSMQVGREAQLINCKASSPIGLVATCYLAHSNVPFSSMNKVERIIIKEEEVVGQVNVARNRQLKRLDASQLSQDAVMRLNHLQQLLGETNVECQSIDVFKALSNIKSIEDLATALDLIASSSTLEGKMGVEGSTFQKLAVSQCKTKLDEAISDAGEEALSNPHVQMLAFKIAYYTQVRFSGVFGFWRVALFYFVFKTDEFTLLSISPAGHCI